MSDVPAGYLNASIVGAAALSQLLELAVIRWQGTVFAFFAFHKNVTLLCRAGLGVARVVGTAATLTYCAAVVPTWIWQARPWSVVWRDLVEGLVVAMPNCGGLRRVLAERAAAVDTLVLREGHQLAHPLGGQALAASGGAASVVCVMPRYRP